MPAPTRTVFLTLAFVPVLFAVVACTDESTSSPSTSSDRDAASDAAVAPDVVAETSDDEHSFTIDGSSVTNLTYNRTAFGASSMPCDLLFYERFTVDLPAKSLRVETCIHADGGKADETRALSEDGITALRGTLARLRLISFSDFNGGECSGHDGLNVVLSLETSAKSYAISDHHSCSAEVADTVARDGLPSVRAKLYELAGLPPPTY